MLLTRIAPGRCFTCFRCRHLSSSSPLPLPPLTAVLAASTSTTTTTVRPLSSGQWMDRHLRDQFVKKARYHNYRARSAFKLIQMDDRHRLLRPGMIVIECGAAPGSWTQVLVQRLKLEPPDCWPTGAVLAVDILNFTPVAGAVCLPKTDFTSPLSQAKILSALNGRKADLLLSDMAPNVTGQHSLDHERILKLVYSALQFATVVLKQPGGSFLTKIFNGSQTDRLIAHLEGHFESVKQVKPQASRGDSTELYLLAERFKARH
ncbi:rRNA methyltransferase 2, mitochondrial [Tyrophagus putrescentiae]|nr:rRNA methyltransferase 2, mitochondrial [Tyrophagus putrescentiae]